jgi:hypothetical protein
VPGLLRYEKDAAGIIRVQTRAGCGVEWLLCNT